MRCDVKVTGENADGRNTSDLGMVLCLGEEPQYIHRQYTVTIVRFSNKRYSGNQEGQEEVVQRRRQIDRMHMWICGKDHHAAEASLAFLPEDPPHATSTCNLQLELKRTTRRTTTASIGCNSGKKKLPTLIHRHAANSAASPALGPTWQLRAYSHNVSSKAFSMVS
ncbi:hypothetical protein ACMFMG_002181 [Clarireedia jacksonii]